MDHGKRIAALNATQRHNGLNRSAYIGKRGKTTPQLECDQKAERCVEVGQSSLGQTVKHSVEESPASPQLLTTSLVLIY